MPQRPVKWARVKEIDRRTKVGTAAWFRRHPPRVRKLSAWRRLHMLGSHSLVREQARLRRRTPSSSMTVRQMLSSIKTLSHR